MGTTLHLSNVRTPKIAKDTQDSAKKTKVIPQMNVHTSKKDAGMVRKVDFVQSAALGTTATLPNAICAKTKILRCV
jgi:hypothetical protein